jgi:uncharacterized protein YutE (UPF0331/DUF86 family)
MTFIVERLVELRRHLDHLEELRGRVGGAADLLLTVCQLVIDISGELAARHGLRFEDYTSAVRALEQIRDFPADMVAELARLPGFRNVLIHEYVELDLSLAAEALERLEVVRQFVRLVANLEDTDT